MTRSMLTDENYPEFKKLYNDAVENNRSQFTFEGACIITGYAKYLIEYIELNKK